MHLILGLYFLGHLAVGYSSVIDLGAASTFGAFAYQLLVNTGQTNITGDIGVYQGFVSFYATGFPPGAFTGSQYLGDSYSQIVLTDAQSAYDAVMALSEANPISGSLGGQSLSPGVYQYSASATLTGVLTLAGTGSPDDAWYFQFESFFTASEFTVQITGGGLPCNVFWAIAGYGPGINGADFDVGVDFVGTVLVNGIIGVAAGAAFNGGLFAIGGQIALNDNSIQVASCTPTGAISSSTSSATTSTSFSSFSSTSSTSSTSLVSSTTSSTSSSSSTSSTSSTSTSSSQSSSTTSSSSSSSSSTSSTSSSSTSSTSTSSPSSTLSSSTTSSSSSGSTSSSTSQSSLSRYSLATNQSSLSSSTRSFPCILSFPSPSALHSNSSTYITLSRTTITFSTPTLISSSTIAQSISSTLVPTSIISQASSTSSQLLTVSTVYSTTIYTITSCAPTVTDCPARIGSLTTEIISLYTTVCPISTSGATSSTTNNNSASTTSNRTIVPLSITSELSTTYVLYTTTVYTITSCAATVTDCPARIGSSTTETLELYTTVLPVAPFIASTTNVYLSSASENLSNIFTISSSTSSTLAQVPETTSLITLTGTSQAALPTSSQGSEVQGNGTSTGNKNLPIAANSGKVMRTWSISGALIVVWTIGILVY